MTDAHQTLRVKQKFEFPNLWDMGAFLIVFFIIIGLGWTANQMVLPYKTGAVLPISLSPRYLPEYAFRSIVRMGIGILLSLLFTFVVGTWAAKSQRAGRFLIPLIDVLQSIPVLAFQAIAIVPFIHLFPGSLLGPECVAIYAIFTSQVWNMTLSFYQSLRSIPNELREAADMYQLSAWQRFWRVEVPTAIPGLLWNTMMSMSASWFFVVASEAIVVAHQNITLPGIGSYIAVAIAHADKQAVLYAIIAMFFIILLYDQLLFRPLLLWSEKFLPDQVDSDVTTHSWVVLFFRRTQWIRAAGELLGLLADQIVGLKIFAKKPGVFHSEPTLEKAGKWLWFSVGCFLVGGAGWMAFHFMRTTITWHQVGMVIFYGFATTLRVISLIIIACIIWIPVGVWIGLHPKIVKWVQPLIQFFAAFPAYLLYPVVFMIIVNYHLNVNIWCVPLMMLGAQWYILFNVIAGTVAIPKDLRQSADNMGVQGWLWWKRVILPAIFPYLITGAITAAGGAWNASIVAEVVSWGHTTLTAVGLGAFITETTRDGQFPQIALGIGVMILYVIALNRFIWRPLYGWAEDRFQYD